MTAVEAPLVDYNVIRDVNSQRGKFGVIIPSTNTTVEHDFHAVGPRGVTFPVGRMYIPEPRSADDTEFAAMIDQVHQALDDAVKRVMTTSPDYLILAMSAPTFWGGTDSNRSMAERMREVSGLSGVTTGSEAVVAGLRAIGASRIAFLSPYQPIGDLEVKKYFEESDFDVVRHLGFKVPSIDRISSTPVSALIEALKRLDGDDIDAIVQVGTNLSMARLADEAERWLEKPVLTINTASLWHGLRSMGITDQFDGFGCLLRDH